MERKQEENKENTKRSKGKLQLVPKICIENSFGKCVKEAENRATQRNETKTTPR